MPSHVENRLPRAPGANRRQRQVPNSGSPARGRGSDGGERPSRGSGGPGPSGQSPYRRGESEASSSSIYHMSQYHHFL